MSRNRQSHPEVRVLSHRGLVRPTNQDVAAVLHVAADVPILMGVVADGMGGHNGGAHASQSVLAHLHRKAATAALQLGLYGEEWRDELTEFLVQTVEEINSALWAEAQSNPELHGMGTTVVLAVFLEGWCGVLHVGDSRAYRYRAGKATQLTIDHSWGEEQRLLGRATEGEIAESPLRAQLTRAMGAAPDVEPEVTWCRLEKGDLVLLCSDGLTHHVSASEIAWFLKRFALKADQHLLKAALDRGGHDNISLVLLRQTEPVSSRLPPPRSEPGHEVTDERWRAHSAAAPTIAPARPSLRRTAALGGLLALALAVLFGAVVSLFRTAELRTRAAESRAEPPEVRARPSLEGRNAADPQSDPPAPDDSAIRPDSTGRQNPRDLPADSGRLTSGETPAPGSADPGGAEHPGSGAPRPSPHDTSVTKHHH